MKTNFKENRTPSLKFQSEITYHRLSANYEPQLLPKMKKSTHLTIVSIFIRQLLHAANNLQSMGISSWKFSKEDHTQKEYFLIDFFFPYCIFLV